MKLNPQDLEKITNLTLSHYNERAEAFWEGTRDHDVNQNITALLQCIEGEPSHTILDFGCGAGRDLKVFAELGHIAVGLEGAEVLLTDEGVAFFTQLTAGRTPTAPAKTQLIIRGTAATTSPTRRAVCCAGSATISVTIRPSARGSRVLLIATATRLQNKTSTPSGDANAS